MFCSTKLLLGKSNKSL